MKQLFSLTLCFSLMSCSLPQKPFEAKETGNKNFVTATEYTVATLVENGIDSFKRARYEDARDFFLQAKSLAPLTEAIEANLALSYIKTGEFEAALSLYERLIDAHPSQGEYRFGYAAALRGEGRIAESLHHYRESFKALPLLLVDLPQRLQLERSFLQVNWQLGLVDEAICLADEAYVESTLSSDLLTLVSLLSMSGQYQKVISVLTTRYPKGVPDTEGQLLHVKALAHLALGDQDEFFAHEAKAKNSYPLNEALNNEIEFIEKVYLMSKEEIQSTIELTESAIARDKISTWPVVLVRKFIYSSHQK